jgi:hypothetical protein
VKKSEKGSFPNIIRRLEEGGQAGLNDLSHDELLRAQALGQACQYYLNTIIKDGELYREMVRDNRVLKPATYMGVIEVAFNFEHFIRGEFAKDRDAVDAILEKTAPIKEAKKEMEQEAEKPVPSAE